MAGSKSVCQHQLRSKGKQVSCPVELRMKTQPSSPDPESGIGFVSVFLAKELSTTRW